MPEGSPKNSILIVEDDEEIAYLIRFLLEREGFKVDHVADGKQAFDWIKHHPPCDLMLLDLMLPYRDGFQIIQELRSHEAWKPVPVLILSAKSQESDIVRALDTGANDYLTKPFQPLELLARVKRLLK